MTVPWCSVCSNALLLCPLPGAPSASLWFALSLKC